MDIPETLPESLLRERLTELADLYARADAAVAAFQAASGLGCPFGCGSCCEGFVPDIMPVEAAYVAAFLAAADPPRARSLAASGLEAVQRVGADGAGRKGCPLYAGDTPYHCTVYEARPLVCRMFAFSAVRNKTGSPEFSLCRLMPESARHAGLRSVGASDQSGFGSAPPVMADYGSRVVSIDPDSASGRLPLPEALENALSRVLFLAGVRLADRNDDQYPER